MYKRGVQGWVKHLDFIGIDLLCVLVAYYIAYLIRFDDAYRVQMQMYKRLGGLVLIVDVCVILFAEIYKNVLKRTKYKELEVTFRQTVMLEVLLSFYLFTVKESGNYSRIVLYLFGVIYFVMAYLARCVWKRVVRRKLANSTNKSLLVIAVTENVEDVLEHLNAYRKIYGAFMIAGVILVDEDQTGMTIHGVPVVAGTDSMLEYICREWVDEVFIDLPRDMRYPDQMMERLREMGIATHVKLVEYEEGYAEKQFVEKMGVYTVLTYTTNSASELQLLLKRLLDIIGGLVGCLITGILCIIIGPMISKESPGPIFFAQERIGLNGKRFKIFKFRSMYLDAEERKKELMKQNDVKDGMMFKVEWDPRIIGAKVLPDGRKKRGIGNIIRDYSLDEFPQFFNVLIGDMSLVGTRPPTVDEWEKYQFHHRGRLATKPGITGMWQVSGRSNIKDFEEVVKLDQQYIQNWSIWLDVKLLFKTVKIVFKKEGAR